MIRCQRHPQYNGMRLGKRAKECPECVAYYKAQKEAGNKEKRQRKTHRKSQEESVVVGAKKEELTGTATGQTDENFRQTAEAESQCESVSVGGLASDLDMLETEGECDPSDCASCRGCQAESPDNEDEDDFDLPPDVAELL